MALPEEEWVNNPWEWSAVSELVHAHRAELGDRLRAALVFGDLAARRLAVDTWLLEVVDGWSPLDGEEPMATEFASSAHLPLRGRLYYVAVSPEDFEHLSREGHHLLREIAAEYEVVSERDPGYVSGVLSRARHPRVALRAVGAV